MKGNGCGVHAKSKVNDLDGFTDNKGLQFRMLAAEESPNPDKTDENYAPVASREFRELGVTEVHQSDL